MSERVKYDHSKNGVDDMERDGVRRGNSFEERNRADEPSVARAYTKAGSREADNGLSRVESVGNSDADKTRTSNRRKHAHSSAGEQVAEWRPIERRTKTPEQALNALMRYCAKAERSSGDARRLMKSWGVPDADQSGVLARLRELKFIDDVRFANAFVRYKSQFDGWGIYKIRAGLKAKGIAAEIISEAIAGIDTEENKDKLMSLLERKARTVKGNTAYEVKTKLIRFGLSRGFEYDDVLSAAEKVVNSNI